MKFTKEEGLDHAHLEQEGPGTTTFICQPCGAPVSSSSVCSLQPCRALGTLWSLPTRGDSRTVCGCPQCWKWGGQGSHDSSPKIL